MKIGFTGTQQGMTGLQRVTVLYLFGTHTIDTLHHGDCVGADQQAHRMALEMHARVVVHPPDDHRKRGWAKGAHETRPPLGYLDRNRRIVENCDLLIATPATDREVLRSGTWATVRYARRCKRPVYVVRPDGTCAVENPFSDVTRPAL